MRRGTAIPEACEGILQIKATQAGRLVSTLTAKPIHKVHYHQTSMVECIDTEGTFASLVNGRFRAETKVLVIMAQNGVVLMNCYIHDVFKTSAIAQCRACREGEEFISHIISVCKPHMWSLNKKRHHRVVYQVIIAFAKKLKVKVPDS